MKGRRVRLKKRCATFLTDEEWPAGAKGTVDWHHPPTNTVRVQMDAPPGQIILKESSYELLPEEKR